MELLQSAPDSLQMKIPSISSLQIFFQLSWLATRQGRMFCFNPDFYGFELSDTDLRKRSSYAVVGKSSRTNANVALRLLLPRNEAFKDSFSYSSISAHLSINARQWIMWKKVWRKIATRSLSNLFPLRNVEAQSKLPEQGQSGWRRRDVRSSDSFVRRKEDSQRRYISRKPEHFRNVRNRELREGEETV